MLREGPIPAFVHGLYEYLGGGALIAIPLLLNYRHGAATAVSIVLGVLVIVLAAMTASSTSLVNQLPLAVHVLLDYALAAILIASPFLFGFSPETTPTAIFIGGGVLHLLISIGTRFKPSEKPASRGRGRRIAPTTEAAAAGLPTEGGARGGAAEPLSGEATGAAEAAPDTVTGGRSPGVGRDAEPPASERPRDGPRRH